MVFSALTEITISMKGNNSVKGHECLKATLYVRKQYCFVCRQKIGSHYLVHHNIIEDKQNDSFIEFQLVLTFEISQLHLI